MENNQEPGTRPGHNGGGRLQPPWTREEASEKGRKGAKAKRAYTLRGALSRRLKARLADGSRPWDGALDALVEKLLEGDVRAIELALNHVDGPLVQRREVDRLERRQLVILPSSDPRAEALEAPQVVDAQAVTTDPPPCATYGALSDAGKAQSSQVHVAQGDTSVEAQGDNDDAGGSEGQGGT
jgi:hypothetical protein